MVKMKVPVGMTGVSYGGENYTADKDGVVEVPDVALVDLKAHGLSVYTEAAHTPGPEDLKAHLRGAISALPAAIASGEYKDEEYVVSLMKGFYKEHFTAEVEAEVRGLFLSSLEPPPHADQKKAGDKTKK